MAAMVAVPWLTLKTAPVAARTRAHRRLLLVESVAMECVAARAGRLWQHSVFVNQEVVGGSGVVLLLPQAATAERPSAILLVEPVGMHRSVA
jgi:hypothetical protein